MPAVAVVENNVLSLALFCMVILVLLLLILLVTGPYIFLLLRLCYQISVQSILKPTAAKNSHYSHIGWVLRYFVLFTR